MSDTVNDLNQLAKEVFSKKPLPDLIPNGAKIQKAIPFSSAGEVMGLKFVETVRLAYPTGFTHAKGDATAGAFTLGDAVAGVQKRAEITGSQILLRDQMSYEDAAKLTSGEGEAKEKAFANGTKYFFEGMQRSIRKRIESQLWYGAQSLGVISGTPSTIHTSNKLITFTAATWAPGHWVGNEGMQLDCYNGASQINTNATLVLVAVDTDAMTIEVSGNATDLGNLADTYKIYFRGAYGNEMTGIMGVLANTGSLYGIDAATYTLWKSAQYTLPTSGPLSFKGVKKALGRAVSKGLDEDIDLYMNFKAWDDVLDDIVAMRRTDREDLGKVAIGASEIEFHGQSGKVKLIPSMFLKEGHAAGLCGASGDMGYWRRLGAKDVTFKAPGFGDDMFIHLQTKAGIESRAYTHQTIFCDAPAKQLLISGIVNSTD